MHVRDLVICCTLPLLLSFSVILDRERQRTFFLSGVFQSWVYAYMCTVSVSTCWRGSLLPTRVERASGDSIFNNQPSSLVRPLSLHVSRRSEGGGDISAEDNPSGPHGQSGTHPVRFWRPLRRR